MTTEQILEQIELWILAGRIGFDEMQFLSGIAYANEQQNDERTSNEKSS